ncbi:MAG: hypothetical protein HYT73_01740 [Candidatus Aenigmarchaeota archaeon]|nr:hypothetical protein [Candidatus Aenigmarchaeota archaeon]
MHGVTSIRNFISITILLIMLVGFASPLQASVQDVINTDASLQAELIASKINVLRAAPDGTGTRISLPDAKCTVKFENTFLTITYQKAVSSPTTVTKHLIQNPTVIQSFEEECPNSFFLKKNNGVISVD